MFSRSLIGNLVSDFMNSRWLPCCYRVSIKLVVVPMEYIFIHTKKDVIAGKNNGMKN